MYEYRMIALNDYLEEILDKKKSIDYQELISTFKDDISSYELIEILCNHINTSCLINNKKDIRRLSELSDQNAILWKKYETISRSWDTQIRKNTKLQNQIISLKRQHLDDIEKINDLEQRLKISARDLEGLRNLNRSKI